MRKMLEICCYSAESAINAQIGGADRVELCDNINEGGTTPSYGQIELTRQKLDIQINVIIRPRGGDFCYSDFEFDIMKNDIKIARQLGTGGVVIGLLNNDGTVDKKRTEELIKFAEPMNVTFHRAFDMSKDPFESLEDIIETGADRILTSGMKKTAYEGIDLLSDLISEAAGRIIIMPGCGINESNIFEIAQKTNAVEFHSSAKVFKDSCMMFKNEELSMGNKEVDEYGYFVSGTDKIKEIKRILNEI